jgi:hypothetical protein
MNQKFQFASKGLIMPFIVVMTMWSSGFAQTSYSISTSPPHTTSTTTSSPSGMIFNLKANNPVKIVDMTCGFSGSSGNFEIWYRTDSVNGTASIVCNTSNKWVYLCNGSWSGGSGIVDLKMSKPLRIPKGKTYGIYLLNLSGSAYYSSTSAGDHFGDKNLGLYMGANVNYASISYGSSYITGRWYCGKVTYQLDYSAPDDAGVSELVSPVNFCSGTQTSLCACRTLGPSN